MKEKEIYAACRPASGESITSYLKSRYVHCFKQLLQYRKLNLDFDTVYWNHFNTCRSCVECLYGYTENKSIDFINNQIKYFVEYEKETINTSRRNY